MKLRTTLLLLIPLVLFVSYRTIKKDIQAKPGSRMSGCVLIAKSQDIIYTKCEGYLNVEKQTKLDLNSEFMIGSISKQFTAVALLKALSNQFSHLPPDEQIKSIKAELFKPISAFLPSNHPIWAGDMPPWANQINLHELLTHTSGIWDYRKLKKANALENDGKYFYDKPHRPDELISLIKHKKLKFHPGTGSEYSNSNYILAVTILEEITKTPHEKYFTDQFFKPLHMIHTYANSDSSYKDLKIKDPYLADQLMYAADDELPKQAEPTQFFHFSNAKGTANIVTSAFDLYRWNQALHVKKTLLSPELYEMMHREYKNKEGYGNYMYPSLLGTLRGYGGRVGSFASLVLYEPKRKLTIVYFSNILEDEKKSNDWLGYRTVSNVVNKYVPDDF